jgi:glucose-6-phosphate isomerase
VLHDRKGFPLEVEPGTTSGDYLQGFLLGTRTALHEKDRESITITIRNTSSFSIGVLIALFERTVGLYASLINVNAYHQPGVQAGKDAATTILDLKSKISSFLKRNKHRPYTPDEIAEGIRQPDAAETVFKVCEHLASNRGRGVRRVGTGSPGNAKYRTQ